MADKWPPTFSAIGSCPFCNTFLAGIKGMAITPNRDALKYLASFAIDAQFCQQYGAQVFHYFGDANPTYQHLCANLLQFIDQMTADLAAIKAHIPAFDVDEDRQEQA